MREITVTRVVYSKEDLRIKKTWRDAWIRMVKEERKYGHFYILYGDWSGYRPEQQRITHVDFLPHHDAKRLQLRSVVFTDGTSMSVWTEPMTISLLLAKGLMRKQGYTSLLEKAMAAGKVSYDV